MSASYEISQLWRYPVKSMAGEQLAEAEVRPGGLVGDRAWAIRSIESGKIVSAKRPSRYASILEWHARTVDDGVAVTAPDGVTRSAGTAELDDALSTALGESVMLVPVEVGAEETYDSEWPEIPGTVLSNTEVELAVAMMTEKVSFVDLAALHIVVEGSMAHLAARSGAELGVERFRPNIVLRATDGSGADGFADLVWADMHATAGSVGIHISDAAPRCVMTTLPQGRYGSARSILSTLATEARKELGVGPFACFGTYAEVTAAGSMAEGQSFAFTKPTADPS